ncbi:MAG TPA: RNA polymerase sigma factor [Kofleriaceae bacterium]|nr:RNA polymerase sigma factor [Kofleriaceae bacterium]
MSEAAVAEKLEEERRLVAEAQAGNLDAMRPILESYAAPLYATVILPRLGDPATAEDVLRDTFTTAIEKLDQFRWTGKSIYVWLRQIAVNKAYDVHRRARRSLQLADALAREVPRATGEDQGADALLIAAEEQSRNRARIRAAMEALSERYRTAIELRLIEELPREECARRMNVTTGTFDVVLFRAVRAFRKHFGQRDADPAESGKSESK